MGYLRYRRTVKIIPHLLHLHLAKTGVSLSVGRPPFTVNLRRRGTMLTTSIPGSGLSYRAHVSQHQTQDRKQSPELAWEILGVLLVLCAALFLVFVFFGQG